MREGAGEGGVTVVYGGEAGNAVYMACLNTDPRGGDGTEGTSGDEGRRRAAVELDGTDPPEGVRECDTNRPPGIDLGPGFDKIRDRGAVWSGGDSGDAAWPSKPPPDDIEGEIDRFGGEMVRAVDVA